MDNAALKPNFFSKLPTFVKEEEAKVKGASEEDRHYYNLAHHAGYRQLKEYADSLLEDLDTVTSSAMSQGMTFEEIGRNAVVADLAKGIIRRIFQKVEDAKEAIEKPDGTVR